MADPRPETLLLALDLAGTFVFALSGATAGVKRGLDLFGVFVLALVAGNFGGITRDVLMGRRRLARSATGSIWRSRCSPAPSRSPGRPLSTR